MLVSPALATVAVHQGLSPSAVSPLSTVACQGSSPDRNTKAKVVSAAPVSTSCCSSICRVAGSVVGCGCSLSLPQAASSSKAHVASQAFTSLNRFMRVSSLQSCRFAGSRKVKQNLPTRADRSAKEWLFSYILTVAAASGYTLLYKGHSAHAPPLQAAHSATAAHISAQNIWRFSPKPLFLRADRGLSLHVRQES